MNKLFLHYAGRKYFVTAFEVDRLLRAVKASANAPSWHNLYDRGGAVDGDDDTTLLVGPGIPMALDSEFVEL